MDCHLLIPELLPPESAGDGPHDDLTLPALETFFARGALRRNAGLSLERWLAATFGIAPQHDLPLAPLSLRGDGVAAHDACWVQADPVHLSVRGDQLMLADASCFRIALEDAADLLAALNAHFRDDGLEFIAPAPQRWYARVSAEPRIRTTPTLEAAGRSIERFLPAGDDGARWRRIINETQMLLHEHPRNEARAARGELPVNSVWFWGAGRVPLVGGGAPYGAVWSENPLAAGVAMAAGLALQPLPRSAAEWLEAAVDPPGRPGLVVLDGLRGAALRQDAQARRGALADLEARWFAPLLEGLRRGALRAVTLHALGSEASLVATTTRLDPFKFWRPRRRLASVLAS